MTYRYDLAKFGPKTHTTQAGFLRVPAFFTRAGVFTYHRADGTEVRELRPAEEVFHSDSLATLRGASVVEGHPAEGMITPRNSRNLAIGWTSDTVERADNLVSGEITVMDAQAISKVQSKELSEISLGYTCSVDPTPGHHQEYGRYDQIQRDIRYNHVALGPQDWGRAGSEVSIRLDSAAIAKEEDPRVSWDRYTPPKRADMKESRFMETITIGGVAFEVSPQVAQAYRHNQERADQATADLRSSLETLQGRADAQAEEIKTLKADLAKATDGERFDSAVRERVELERKARSVLGDKAELPVTTREIQEAVLRHDNKNLDLTGKSDDYVAARFDHLIENPYRAPKPGAVRQDALRAKSDPGRPSADEARQRMIQTSQEAWQQPLSVSTRS